MLVSAEGVTPKKRRNLPRTARPGDRRPLHAGRGRPSVHRNVFCFSFPCPILGLFFFFFACFFLEMDQRVAARMTVLVVGRGAGA